MLTTNSYVTRLNLLSNTALHILTIELNFKKVWKRKLPFCDVAMRINGGGNGGLLLERISSHRIVKGVNCKIDALAQINLKEIGAMLQVQMSLKSSEA